MKRINFSVCLLVLLALCANAIAFAQQKKLSLDQVTGKTGKRISFSGNLPAITWAWDGKHISIGEDKQARWIDPSTGAEGKPEPENNKEKKSAEKHKRIDNTKDKEWLSQNSPDERFVSFVKNYHLYIRDTTNNQVFQVDPDGNAELLYGQLDWVYQEEIYGRYNFQASFWSPNSAYLAFLRLKQSNVPDFPVVDHIPFHPDVENLRYPKAGDPNPQVALGVVPAAGGDIVWVDLHAYGNEILLVNVAWDVAGEKVIFQVQDREQTWLDLNEADAKTGKVKTLLRETSKTWVNFLDSPFWLEAESFLWRSERSGTQHFYRYHISGELMNPVTNGEIHCKDQEHLDSKAGKLWFSATTNGIDRQLFVVNLDGSNQLQLTRENGTHTISFNEAGDFFLDKYSNFNTPPEVRLCRANGEIVKVLAKSEVPELQDYAFSQSEYHKVPARDGFLMDATIIKPTDFDPSRAYPVWLITYAGPDAPLVVDKWNDSTRLIYESTWQQFLVQNGMIVFQVNNRTASGRGQYTTEKCYKQFCVQELADLEDAVAWLTKNPWADAQRVGITGWSYGGTMTAYALTHSKAFKLGIAGAGVYDWRNYDTIYTERYMQTPQHNAAGYDKTSCLQAAQELSGYLLLIHGTIDDNVHFQNAVQFVYALQMAGKDFGLMIYPQSDHRIRSDEQEWHLKELEWKAIGEHLLTKG